ncbi:MAG TPA: hypothetical protein PK509_08805 [Catalimonadaceae bacterium]|nr:hypothetical protein [Catalimonadaceae bacterium]HPI10666.1 hypothetical protein [Catalimonadaceae bacterium]
MKRETFRYALRLIHRLGDATLKAIRQGKTEQTRTYISLATILFENGSEAVRSAIASSYLGAVADTLESRRLSCRQWLSPRLFEEYRKQIFTAAI